jgi:hypothetical protein
MDVLKYLENKYPEAVTKRCEDAGCSLKLNDLDEYIVLKGERIFPHQPICDCIVFIKKARTIAGVVELKSKTVDVSQVRQQLKGGLQFVFEAITQCGKSMKCYVVVLARRWRTSEYRVIISKKIEVDGIKYSILPKRCGISFSEIISRFRN